MLLKRTIPYIIMAMVLSAFVLLGYGIERTQFSIFLFLMIIAFVGYIVLLNSKEISLKHLLYFSFICRAVFIFSVPVLSDDYFRFLWDGHLINLGINPFLFIPSSLVGAPLVSSDQMLQFFLTHMNSPDYFSVYPTIMQGIFAFATWLFPLSIKYPLILWHAIIMLAELGTVLLGLKILKELRLPKKNILWYALNPLVIVELTGNLHFEAVMIFFLAVAIYYFQRSKIIGTSLGLSAAVAVKLLPLLTFPFFIKALSRKKQIIFLLSGLVGLVILFSPLLHPDTLLHLGNSIGLYFHSFEFNGSIYKIFRWVGFVITETNIIFIWAVLSPLLLLFFYFKIFKAQKTGAVPILQSLLIILTIYFLLSSVVHPWYISSLIFLNIFFNYRYIQIWSGLVMLSYYAYSHLPYQESIFLTWVEYLPVIILCLVQFKEMIIGKEHVKQIPP